MEFAIFLRFCLLSFLWLTGCGVPNYKRDSVPSAATPESVQKLADKSANYEQLAPFDSESGFVTHGDLCDSLFFTGLVAAALPERAIDLTQARESSAEVRWFRDAQHTCGPANGTSRSTISRDQVLGLMWWAWRAKQLEPVESLLEDLRHNGYFLRGEGTPGELFTGPILHTLALEVEALGGTSPTVVERTASSGYSTTFGFVSHLTAWQLALDAEIAGTASDGQLDTALELAQREPKNPLFTLVYQRLRQLRGLDFSVAAGVNLLLDSTEWPSARLPSSNEHCAEWPIQRAYQESDWGSCDLGVVHSGLELVVLYRLLIAN